MNSEDYFLPSSALQYGIALELDHPGGSMNSN